MLQSVVLVFEILGSLKATVEFRHDFDMEIFDSEWQFPEGPPVTIYQGELINWSTVQILGYPKF